MSKELISAVRHELGLAENSATDDVIELYIIEGEKQLKNYIKTVKLTTSLMFLLKGYVLAKMNENGNKYNSDVELDVGLDEVFIENIGIINTHKSFKAGMQANLKNYDKSKF